MQPELVMFDVGGVLVELGGVGEFAQMLGGADEERVWRTWLGSDAVRRFERGRCGPETFAQEIIVELSLAVTPADFLARFSTWSKRPYPGALELVAAVRRRVSVACLSNSNALHWEGPARDFGLHDAFDHTFVSHQMGVLKPDAEAFSHVVARVEMAAERILFLDDNRINVDAARACGIDAHLVRGTTEARSLLSSRALCGPTWP